MSSGPLTPLQRAWFRWKTLRLPWRKKFLVGLDLSGATFWEFADKLSPSSTRMRRIVQPPSHLHYSDVSAHISPAWHQWLRHTRRDPPSLTEQSQDLIRQEQLKVLVAQADARWEAKRRYVDAPEGMGRERGQPVPALRPMDQGGDERDEKRELREQRPMEVRNAVEKEKKEDPWKKARGGPSEEWQPEAWDPNALAARRL